MRCTDKRDRRRFVAAGLGLVTAVLLPAIAAAQDYPSRPIRLIVPFAPGGPADLLARAVAPSMGTSLKQTVVIENRAGAGGATGVAAVTTAEPDGYTIGITGPGAVVAAPYMTKVPYDHTKDFIPITRVAQMHGIVVVAASSPYKTLAELIAAARANPGKLSFASAGSGTLTHLAGELLNIEANVKIVHVPYRGAAPAVADLLGGHVQFMLPDMSGALGGIRGGTIRALAVTSGKRSPFLPDVPTTAEAGFPQVLSDSWYGLIAPAGTPPAIVKALYEAAAGALKGNDVAAQIDKQGGVAAPTTPEEFKALIIEEQQRWKRVVETTGAKME